MILYAFVIVLQESKLGTIWPVPHGRSQSPQPQQAKSSSSQEGNFKCKTLLSIIQWQLHLINTYQPVDTLYRARAAGTKCPLPSSIIINPVRTCQNHLGNNQNPKTLDSDLSIRWACSRSHRHRLCHDPHLGSLHPAFKSRTWTYL